ncbi:MAG: hypothetical protein ACK57B_01000 [Betaproteobacteria bacterium]|jgi:hypothetical protein
MTTIQCATRRGEHDAAVTVNGANATPRRPTALAIVPCGVLP